MAARKKARAKKKAGREGRDPSTHASGKASSSSKKKAKKLVKALSKSATAKKTKPAKKSLAKAGAKEEKKKKTKKKVKASKRRAGSAVYGGMVAEIIQGQSRVSSYTPKAPMNLSIARRRPLRVLEDFLPIEREQLEAVFHPESLEAMLPHLESLEVAEVVDDAGTVLYRLYGWDYGVGYLFSAIGLEVLGFGAQHDIEHWRPEQRDLFVAMDRALRTKEHGFEQPLSFCWWDDKCWKAIEGKPPGTVGSEPVIRQKLMKALN